MIQEILTYLIVAAAMGYVAYKFVRLFTKSKNALGCGGSCSCEAKKQFQKNIKP